MKLTRIRCTNCGADFQELPNHASLVVCRHCRASFDLSQGLAFSEIEQAKAERIGRLREGLSQSLSPFSAHRAETYAREILAMLPEDFRAGLALALCESVTASNPLPLRRLLKDTPCTREEFSELFPALLSHSDYPLLLLLEEVAERLLPAEELSSIRDQLAAQKETLRRLSDDYADVPRDLFLCHSSLNETEVRRVLEALEADGNRCWVSFRNLRPDSPDYWAEIEQAISHCQLFLVLCSEAAMLSMDVQRELRLAEKCGKTAAQRLELKLDTVAHTTQFKHFFDGISWVEAGSDLNAALPALLERVYTLRHQQESALRQAPSEGEASSEQAPPDKTPSSEQPSPDSESASEQAPPLPTTASRKGAPLSRSEESSFSDAERRFARLSQLALTGSADALFELGRCYEGGLGTSQNDRQALRCYEQAAERIGVLPLSSLRHSERILSSIEPFAQSHLQAQEPAEPETQEALFRTQLCERIGSLYYEKRVDAPVTNQQILYYLVRPALAGDAKSCYRIGMVYTYDDWGGTLQESFAYPWLKKAAELGHPLAGGMLGIWYYYGRPFLPSDKELAFSWLVDAVDHLSRGGFYDHEGARLAMLRCLALCYQNGYGTSPDPVQAQRLLIAAGDLEVAPEASSSTTWNARQQRAVARSAKKQRKRKKSRLLLLLLILFLLFLFLSEEDEAEEKHPMETDSAQPAILLDCGQLF